MSRKRISALLVVLVIVAVLAVASWIAGSAIQSPAEAAARTAPPQPSPILVPVEERVLTADVVLNTEVVQPPAEFRFDGDQSKDHGGAT